MKRKTIKSLEADLVACAAERDAAKSERNAADRQFSGYVRTLAEALFGEKSYQKDNDDVLKAVRQLLDWKRRNEGAEDARIAAIDEELDRAWYLIRSLTNDKLLGGHPPYGRHDRPGVIVDGKPHEPMIDTFPAPRRMKNPDTFGRF